MNRHDFEYIRGNNIPGWQEQWSRLLEGRFAVLGGDLVEDSSAPIYMLGFTVDEVAEVIRFTGYTQREVEWFELHPGRYKLVNGVWDEIEGWRDVEKVLSLSESLRLKRSEIQQEKCRIRDSGIIVDGTLFDTDAAAQSAYVKFLLATQLNQTYTIKCWKASDGVFVPMDLALVVKVLTASGNREALLTSVQEQKYTEVSSLTDGVEDYDATTGWNYDED